MKRLDGWEINLKPIWNELRRNESNNRLNLVIEIDSIESKWLLEQVNQLNIEVEAWNEWQ